MLRCSVEMRQRYSHKKCNLYDYVNFAYAPGTSPPISKRNAQKHTTRLSTQRPRQKGTTKSLHDMSSMIVLAKTEGASSTWLQCQARGPVIERGPHLMPRVRCLERRDSLTSSHGHSVLRLEARPPVVVAAAAGAPQGRPVVAAAAAAAQDPPSAKKSRQTAQS